jgi:CheY-like chemotaxis protein
MQSSVQRLLVVEDDATVARALARTLSRRGFAVAITRSCAAARALAQRFDLAVLDLDLPDGDGVTLAGELLASGRVPNVFFFTGSSDQGLLARARRLGSVVMKAGGTAPLLALLPQEQAEPPESRTAPSSKARGTRAVSGVSPSPSASASRAGLAPVSDRKSRMR